MTPIRRLAWSSLALVALVGCDVGVSTPVTPPTPPTTGGTAGNATGSTAGATTEPKASTEIKPMPVDPGKGEEPKKEGAANPKLSDEEIAAIKKLPADEQPIAMAQMVCPVSDEHLGEMGAPIKQKIGDKTFFICCAGCEKAVKANPDEVLAKLANLKK